MSFFLDTLFLLPISGIFIVALTHLIQKRGWIREDDQFFTKIFSTIYLIIFYIFSGSLFAGFSASGANPLGLGYLNDRFFAITKLLYPGYYSVYPDASSTEFMFSSAQFWLKNLGAAPFNSLGELANYPLHLFIGIGLFMTYPFFLKIGIRLGEILIGSKNGKKGIIYIFNPLSTYNK